MKVRGFVAAIMTVFAVVSGPAAGAAFAHVKAGDAFFQQRAFSNSRPDRHTRVCAAAAKGRASCGAIRTTDTVAPMALTSPPAGYAPADLQAAYSLPSGAAGAGKTVAVVAAFDAPNAHQDLAVYRAQYGLAPCDEGCFRKVNQSGATSTLPAYDPGWAQEIALDLAMVSAACPNCNLLLVEANSASLDDLGTSVDTAVALGAQVVSNSWGIPEATSGDPSAYEPHFNHPGIAITVSAGDQGYETNYPASSQYVTAVGGTRLSHSPSTRGWSESAWSGGGSGCSAWIAKPAWQRDTGCSRRTVADLAAVADPSTPVAVYSSAAGGWTTYGGTSVSAPLVAGMYALAGAPAASANPVQHAYTATSGLNDVLSGSNGTCTPAYLCNAGAGYDGPTGSGTPDGTAALGSPTTRLWASMRLNDFNGDGKTDLIARDTSGELWLYPGTGTGDWSKRIDLGAGWNTMTSIVSAGDFNGDGQADVIARDARGELWLYPGTGTGAWSQRKDLGSGWNIMTSIVAPGDFNGDGKPDLIARDNTGELWLYPNNGDGDWFTRIDLGSGWNIMSSIVAPGDFDGDGMADLIARDASGELWLYPGNGNRWLPRRDLGSGWNVMGAITAPGDMNTDTKPDLIARDTTGELWLYPNNGTGDWFKRIDLGRGWNTMSAIL